MPTMPAFRNPSGFRRRSQNVRTLRYRSKLGTTIIDRRGLAIGRARGRAGAANVRTGDFQGRPEIKFADAELAAEAFTAAWVAKNPAGTGMTDSISVPVVGTGEENRDGRVYYIHSIHVHGKIQLPGTESDAAPQGGPTYARLCLVWDTQTNAAEITATDVMDAGGTDDTMSFRNLQNSSRFIVLKDKTFVLRPAQGNEGAVNVFYKAFNDVRFKWNKSFKKPIKVRCVGTTADVASVSDNSLSIIGIANNTNITLEYQSRLRFTG